MVMVGDDLVTSGRIMRLTVEAIRAAGVAASGFAFSRVGGMRASDAVRSLREKTREQAYREGQTSS
jgi:hypothetical protein